MTVISSGWQSLTAEDSNAGRYEMAPAAGLAPPEGDGPRPVRTLLHQRLVKLAAGPAVDSGPALLAVVLQHTKQKTNQ